MLALQMNRGWRHGNDWDKIGRVDAVMYAAGRATRLGREYSGMPKVLLEVEGRSLLDRHAERLARAGVRVLHLVTGHHREKLLGVLPGIRRRHGLEVAEWFNPDFMEGSVVSMGVSLPVLERATESLLLMDADVLYSQAVMDRLVGSEHRCTMLVDFGYAAPDDDPVLVPVRDGLPFDMVKQWTGHAERVGESVGFFKVSPDGLRMLARGTRARMEGLARRESLDDVIREVVMAGMFGVEDVTGLPWTEIDFPHDVARARDEVLPGIAAEEAVGRRRVAAHGP